MDGESSILKTTQMINENIFPIISKNAKAVQSRIGSKGYSSKECIQMAIDLMKLDAIQKQTRAIERNSQIVNDLYKVLLEKSDDAPF